MADYDSWSKMVKGVPKHLPSKLEFEIFQFWRCLVQSDLVWVQPHLASHISFKRVTKVNFFAPWYLLPLTNRLVSNYTKFEAVTPVLDLGKRYLWSLRYLRDVDFLPESVFLRLFYRHRRRCCWCSVSVRSVSRRNKTKLHNSLARHLFVRIIKSNPA